MTRVASSLLLAVLSVASRVAAAHAFSISTASPKVSLGDGDLLLELRVAPPQPDLTALTVETVVDTEGQTVASDVQANGDGTTFIAPLSQLNAGLYKMKVSAEEPTSKQHVYEIVPFKVTAPAEIAELKINGDVIADGFHLDHPQLSSASNDGLIFELKLRNKLDKKPLVAHQAFLQFTHTLEKTNTYFALTYVASSKVQKAVINFASLSKKFAYKSGTHTVQLIVGDAKFDAAIVRDLGSVELVLAAAPPQAPSPLYAKPLLHESDTTLKALPEIKHIMREQDPRPPITVSLAFTAAVLTPLGGFLLFVHTLRLNITKLFRGSVFVFGVGFLASLAAILSLFAWYWIELTMFQTLGYLSVVGSANVVFGHMTLKRLAQDSVKHKTKHE